MRIISEITNKEYSSVEECLAAEAKFVEEQARRREEAKQREEEMKRRRAEVEEALENYHNLLNKYTEDYGSIELKYKDGPRSLNCLIGKDYDIFRFWD